LTQRYRRVGIRNPELTGGGTTSTTTSYWYDPNGGLTGVRDVDHNTLTQMTRDPVERNLRTVQLPDSTGATPSSWQQGTDSTFTYDNDGNVIDREDDGTWDPSARAMTEPPSGHRSRQHFTYNALDQETIAAFWEPHQTGTISVDDSTCAAGSTVPSGVRCVRTTYQPSGERATQRKQDNTLVTTSFDDLGQPTQRVRAYDGQGSNGPATTYRYDERGNRTADSPGEGTYTYNARDQLTSWTRGSDFTGGTTSKVGWTVNYARTTPTARSAKPSTTPAPQATPSPTPRPTGTPARAWTRSGSTSAAPRAGTATRTTSSARRSPSATG
jgi:hypothetical protein